MKKIILLALTAVMMAGCVKNQKEETKVNIRKNNYGFQTIVIDGCEYLIKSEYHVKNYTGTEWGYGYMAHKGNCKYCEQRRKAELWTKDK